MDRRSISTGEWKKEAKRQCCMSQFYWMFIGVNIIDTHGQLCKFIALTRISLIQKFKYRPNLSKNSDLKITNSLTSTED